MADLPKANSEDAGAQFASHFTQRENNKQQLDIATVEEVRKKRLSKYDQIAHECVFPASKMSDVGH